MVICRRVVWGWAQRAASCRYEIEELDEVQSATQCLLVIWNEVQWEERGRWRDIWVRKVQGRTGNREARRTCLTALHARRCGKKHRLWKQLTAPVPPFADPRRQSSSISSTTRTRTSFVFIQKPALCRRSPGWPSADVRGRAPPRRLQLCFAYVLPGHAKSEARMLIHSVGTLRALSARVSCQALSCQRQLQKGLMRRNSF